jgi:hypothetical protein
VLKTQGSAVTIPPGSQLDAVYRISGTGNPTRTGAPWSLHKDKNKKLMGPVKDIYIYGYVFETTKISNQM